MAQQSTRLFSDFELAAIVQAAKEKGVKVAAHANNNEVINALAALGVQSIEHGFAMTKHELEQLAAHGVIWNPTLGAYYSQQQLGNRWKYAKSTFKEALQVQNLKFACGGDTGVFKHGDNSLELKLMVQLGASWNRVLQAATLRGWQCIRSLQWEGEGGARRLKEVHRLREDIKSVGENEMPFGILRVGFAADIIATQIQPSVNFSEAVDPRNIVFVMKTGRVYRSIIRD